MGVTGGRSEGMCAASINQPSHLTGTGTYTKPWRPTPQGAHDICLMLFSSHTRWPEQHTMQLVHRRVPLLLLSHKGTDGKWWW